MLGIEQVLNQIEKLQQDRTFLQCLDNSITVEEVARLLHPLAQLYTLLKLVHDEPANLSFDKVIYLYQHY